jgi:replication-associated recombination protein RarA
MILYIDPGAGSMVIQAVLAGVLAVPFLFRSAIARAIERVRGRRAPSASEKADGGQLPD